LDLIKLGLSPVEPKAGLKEPLSGRKQVAWADPLDLADVKACAKALGGTINDVLLCTATGALQRHFAAHKEAIPDCGIRVAVPFNLLSNKASAVLTNVPGPKEPLYLAGRHESIKRQAI